MKCARARYSDRGRLGVVLRLHLDSATCWSVRALLALARRAGTRCSGSPLGMTILPGLSIRRDARLHVFDNGRREFGGAQFFGAIHQALEVVGDALLADGVLDGAFDTLRGFLP